MTDVEMQEAGSGVIVAAPSSTSLGRPPVQDVYAADREKCLLCVRALRNWIIGSNRQKSLIYEENLLPRFLTLLKDPSSSSELKYEIAVMLGSLAKGSRQQVSSLVACQTVQALIECIDQEFSPLVEVALNCLSSIFATDMAPVDTIYQDNVVPALLQAMGGSLTARVSVCRILSRSCLTELHQGVLCSKGIIEAVAPGIFENTTPFVHQSALNCYSVLCYDNAETSSTLISSRFNDMPILDKLIELMRRSHPMQTQLAAAKCIAYIFRSGGNFLQRDLIQNKVMPTLIKATKDDPLLSNRAIRIDACQVLASLIEKEPELQKLAVYNQQCLPSLAHTLSTLIEEQESPSTDSAELQQAAELEQAAVSLIASMALSDEDIRRKIAAEYPVVLECCMRGLCEEKRNPRMLLAAVKCLHAMSRSVEQLRTTFQDRALWKPLLAMSSSQQTKLACFASGILCNLSLEFSPCREALWDAGILDVFSNLARSDDESLRLNGYWGLMNLGYRSDDRSKVKIMKSVGAERMLEVLTETPPHSPLLLRLLSFLRNTLSTTQETSSGWDQVVDEIMSEHGAPIVQSIIFILEGSFSVEVKELALCLLSNIAAGDSAKDVIMTNDDLLRKILNYLGSSSSRLQYAALMAVMNLICKDDPGSQDRQHKLRQLGAHKVLQQLPEDDPLLSERVKAALQHIS